MLALLDSCFAGINIADFQYGKTGEADAWPVFTLSADDPAELDADPGETRCRRIRMAGSNRSRGRRLPRHPAARRPAASSGVPAPRFLRAPGSAARFPDQRVRGNANLCYFNYRQSGERIGRALIGLDFPSPFERDAMMMTIPSHGDGYRLCQAVDPETLTRMRGL